MDMNYAADAVRPAETDVSRIAYYRMNMNHAAGAVRTAETDVSRIAYYRLDDGRFWSIREAKFVSGLPDGAVAGQCPDEQGNSSLEGLIGCLDFYGYPKGELQTDEEYAAEARAKRNQLIAETDFMMMPDYPLSEAKRAAVAAYRQALRDVPSQSGFPRQIDWPVKP